MKLFLTNEQKQKLSSEAINKKPNESCALLFGKKEEDVITISEIYPAENIEQSPINFTISNEQLLEGYKIAEEKGLEVIGIFHSHPDSEAFPSETDKKFMEINPVVWLIFSVSKKEFRAYMFESQIIPISLIS